MHISEIDPNFKVETQNAREGLKIYNALSEPFRVYGVFHDGKQYRRVPEDVAESTNPGVVRLSKHTAGGRVRFVTNSPYVYLKPMMPNASRWMHMPATNSMGFDLYVLENGRYTHRKTFVPPYDFVDTYDGVVDFSGEEERLITINFPTYGQVYDLFIGVKEGCVLKAAPDFKYEKPIVYYGSSITQGGCASRPGTTYQAFIDRRFDSNHINLGFSGNGRGEQAMAEYIASLDPSIFVMDYDHNAPTLEHYIETHEPFYKTVRAACPDIPIIIMTRPKPKFRLSWQELERIKVARKTYNNAKRRGENVYFIPGYKLTKLCGDEGTVDLTHPTDLGFRSMADGLGEVLAKILK